MGSPPRTTISVVRWPCHGEFPADATDLEWADTIGKTLLLLGRSTYAHGPGSDHLPVTIDTALRIVVPRAHSWVHEFQPATSSGRDRPRTAIGAFRVKMGQTFVPHRGVDNRFTLVLERGLDLDGIVLAAGGTPAQNATVTVVFARRSYHTRGRSYQARTGPNGQFHFEALPQDPSALRAESIPAWRASLAGDALQAALTATAPIRLSLANDKSADGPSQNTPDAPTPRAKAVVTRGGADITATEGGWLSVRTVDLDGQTVPKHWTNPRFIALDTALPKRRIDTMWRDDACLYGPFEPGTYRVGESYSGHDQLGRTFGYEVVEVMPGKVQSVTIDERRLGFGGAPYRLRGRVLVDGQPILGAAVSLSDAVGHLSRAFTECGWALRTRGLRTRPLYDQGQIAWQEALLRRNGRHAG